MSALALRIVACCAMLLDHMGLCWDLPLLRAIGRIAFPVFVYLICNGFKHTSSRIRYALRLGLFALLCQIPFSLFCTNSLTYEKGNVFVTLLVVLLCVWATDALRGHKRAKWFAALPALVGCFLYYVGWLRSDYGAKGIVLAMTFYLFDGKKLWQRSLVVLGCLCSVFYGQVVSLAVQILLLMLRGGQIAAPILSGWELMQLWSLLALPLIFAYNGKKGRTPPNKLAAKMTQYGFYLFYPVHMLLLWLIR